ncbi:LacI family transcriptional regulator [Gleimia sp. 6138-11-ORH1]|uniref:LacI family DNA-binding transcriptional regulator n=1 Tax=Gleimia sp. 6138-11-ORH1 TaxID=2973937 RepID=UPI002167D493|nr:LacI family DNA-binding transcriptional regulator [Gleimia sp. 6138-11-ORH1]MCS4484709.1 LacI family transcriptional regulator [Gleimia sp. 6138-11-ORH1]
MGQGRRKSTRTGPSIADVAKLAGVSAQTVSRISTGAQKVSPATREKVLAAMAELGYVPNRAAQALRSGKFGVLGVLTQQIERTGEALTTGGVVAAALAADYTIALVQTQEPQSDSGKYLVRRLSEQSIDGLIIVQAGTSTDTELSLPPDLPVAVADSGLLHRYPSVNADQCVGMQQAMEHLIGLGHQQIAHVSGPKNSQSALLRQNEWEKALKAKGLPLNPVYQGDWSAHSGYQAGKQIIQQPHITAVMCANDEIAFGVMRAIYEAGLRVPEDISVIGFDGIELGEFVPVPLTTVHQDFAAAGRAMVELVIKQIENGIITDEYEKLIPTKLIIRESTALVRPRK